MNGSGRDRIGDYEILGPVGQGSRGRVFKARCAVANNAAVPQDTIVALKVLHVPGQDARDAERFRERASVLCGLQHEHIVRTLEVFVWRPGEWDEVRCLVTEFLEGETLEARLAKRPAGLDWPDVQAIFAQVMAGLVHASAQGMLHRDLKPSNIFLTTAGLAKIIDFDVLRKDEGGQASTAAWKGSFDYMAPDFVTEADFRGDERSDLFSLGICFYEALTGRLPFDAMGKGAHVAYLNRWFGTEKPPDVSYRSPLFRVLVNARRFVERSVHPDRAQRFASFAEMAETFDTIRYRRIRNDDKEEYELQSVLGRGGFGEVFFARRLRDGMKVAVKHLFAQKQSERFIREARILQRCRHPQICRHIDFFTVKTATEEQYYLVMEYLEGMPGWSLRNRIKKEGALPFEEVVPLFINYLRALQFLHEGKRPIIHRDIKPTNLYAPAGHPEKGCIFDLGVARDVTGTVTYGGIPGTLDYMAPEFARAGADRGSPQSDIYAIGLCFYEAASGKSAYEKLPTNMNVAWTQFQERAEQRREIAFDAPVFKDHPRLAAVLRRATAHDPAERIPSARAMIAELEAVLAAGAEVDAPTRITGATHFTSEPLPILDSATDSEVSLPPLSSRLPSPPPPIPDSGGEPVEKETPAVAASAERVSPPQPLPPPRQTAVPPPPRPPVNPEPDAPAHEDAEPATMATRMDNEAADGLKWAARQRRKRNVLRAAIAVVAIGLVGLSFSLLRGGSGQSRGTEEVEALVGAVKEPQPTAAYVAQVRECLARLRELETARPAAASEWQAHRAAVERSARQVPDQFKERFALASVAREVDEVGRLLGEWEQLKDDLALMGIAPEAYEERLDYMRRMDNRLRFEQTASELQKQLPIRVADDAALKQAEDAAVAYRAFIGRSWEGISGDERRKQFDQIGAAVSNLAIAFVTAQAAAAQGDAGTEAFRALPQKAPALVELARSVYDAGLRRAETVRRSGELLQEAKKLQAEIVAAPSVMALDPLVRRLAVLEKEPAGAVPADVLKMLVDALTARFRDHVAAEIQQARADFAAAHLADGDKHAAAAQALIVQVPERFGRAELSRFAADLAGARKEAEARAQQVAEQKQQMAAEQQRKDQEMQAAQKEQDRRKAMAATIASLADLGSGLARATPAQWTGVYNALAQCDAAQLREPDVKKVWEGTAASLAHALDAGLALREPLAERAVRIETVARILAAKGADVVFASAFAGLQSRLEAQRAKFILRVANASAQALTVSSGDTLRKTIIPPAQRLDFTLPAPAQKLPVALLAEGGEGLKPRTVTFELVPGGGSEMVLVALEKADMEPTGAKQPAAGAETGIFRISVSPKAARILLDGQEVQPGDLTVSSDDNHKLRVEAPGYQTYEQSYRVPTGKTKTIDILLETTRRR